MYVCGVWSDGLSYNFDFDPSHDERRQAALHHHMGTTVIQAQLNSTGEGSSGDKSVVAPRKMVWGVVDRGFCCALSYEGGEHVCTMCAMASGTNLTLIQGVFLAAVHNCVPVGTTTVYLDAIF